MDINQDRNGFILDNSVISGSSADGSGVEISAVKAATAQDELPFVYSGDKTGLDAEIAYIREVSPIPLLSYDDEVRLARASRDGDMDSRHAMIRHNLRLVLSLARRYRNRGVCLLDMVSEGNIGLIRAVEKYDPERGYRFSTYATWWVRQAIDRSIMNHARDVRLPVHVIKEVSHYRRQETLLTNQLGRRPSRAELAAYCGMTLPELCMILDCHESSYDTQQIVPTTEELETESVCDYVEFTDPARPLQRKGIKQTAWRWLNELNEKQREVIARRFGLDGHAPCTLEQVGADIGLTRERVRQIQIEAMRRLKRIANRDGYDVDAFFGSDKLSDHAYLNAC
ncbi:MAG: sigma-70 family RNA polymerase sigma factor [Pseudohongiella sp.]|nr:sigma-70 family RNA polymerase sigma factor [Pseudohongiella sp.]MDO9519824.1 sigma-70 family RNA polymerase sigma factor [Pseudohongiella sp.]MDP2126210.1 sigma-70 family RNA polymerase sigma factor [Pseudohongiella sp.]